jgi:hypothetical protein
VKMNNPTKNRSTLNRSTLLMNRSLSRTID